MFEKYTEEYLLDEARKRGQTLGVDTRQGSIYMDAVTGFAFRAAKYYNDLKTAFDMMFIDSATGDMLDEWAMRNKLSRKQATPAYYNVTFKGVSAKDLVGRRFFVDTFYFILAALDEGYYLQSETPGITVNSILPGKAVTPVNDITGLEAAIIGEIYIEGTDIEKDESLRQRLREKIVRAAENGNAQQYKTWCEEFEGVGRALIYPLEFGPDTVLAIIINSQGASPTQALIDEIQSVIDPGSTGLGEGKAFIGCHFYCQAAQNYEVDISFDAVYKSGYDEITAIGIAKEELQEYFRQTALETSQDEAMAIRYMRVVSTLSNSEGIKDFDSLTLNGDVTNIEVAKGDVAVIGKVVVNGNIL